MSTLLQRGKAKDLAALVSEELAAGTAPKDILTHGLIVGMGIVGAIEPYCLEEEEEKQAIERAKARHPHIKN